MYIQKKQKYKSHRNPTFIIVEFRRFVTFSILDTSATLDYAPRRVSCYTCNNNALPCDVLCEKCEKNRNCTSAGLGSGRGTACARFNCTRLCRRSAVARNSPRAFARRVYETPVAETITNQPVVVDLRKEIVSVGFFGRGSGRDGPGRTRVGSGRGFRVTASARYRRRYPCARPPGRGPNRGQGREPVIGKFQIRGYRHFLFRLPAIVVVIDRLSGEGS